MQPPAKTPTNLVGKRTIMDFQSENQQVRNQALNSLLMRYVKPRIYQQSYPVSPLQSLNFSPAIPSSPEVMSFPGLSSLGGHSVQRYGVPLHQQMRTQVINLGNGMIKHDDTVTASLPGVPYANTRQNRAVSLKNENGMMNRLKELEKQLMEDDDEADESNDASVITNAYSEWSDTLHQSLMITTNDPQKQISPSPASSSSSSSPYSLLPVASPVTFCSKQIIWEAASAINDDRSDVAAEILARVTAPPNPKGNWEQKVLDYTMSALKSRLNPVENPPPVTEMFAEDHVLATQMLYDLSPCFKLGFMAANLAILEAVLEHQPTNKVHVIDFDIGQGGQYVNLLHALATLQRNRPSVLKITTVSESGGGDDRLRSVGKLLSQQATNVGIGLHFRIVNRQLTDLSRETLGCEANEALVVNFAFKLYRIPDESVSEDNPRDLFLRRVKSLSPRLVTLVEQEWNGNSAPFLTRVHEALVYYGALLASIESTVSKDHSDRVSVEEGLGRKLRNSVACECSDRVERCEVFGKWRARMGMAGFTPKPMSRHMYESMRARLSNDVRGNPGFTVKDESGGVGFGWHGRTLTVASAWH